MHTLIFAKNRYSAVFVQQGLQYENLASEIVSMDELEQIQNNIGKIDGLFIMGDHLLNLDRIIEYFCRYRANLPIIVLSEEFNLLLNEFQNLFKIRRFFLRPFPFRLIASEMRMYVFQQKEKFDINILFIRNLKLNRETHEVFYKNNPLHLRNKEFALLEFLMLNQNRVLSREYILESVWDRNANILTNTIDVHVNKLRKKMGYDKKDNYIHTVPRSGYIFS